MDRPQKQSSYKPTHPQKQTSGLDSLDLCSNPSPEELKSAAADMALSDLEGRVGDAQDQWDEESLLDDILDQLLVEGNAGSEDDDPADICTPDESVRLKRELRELGPAVFCERTVDAGIYTAKKLLTAFGVNAPNFMNGQADKNYYSLLSLAMARELAKRAKLSKYNSLDDAVDLIRQSSNIILLTGAGISTSLGIPDFRSKGTGLYAKLAHLGLSDPQEVFDIRTFRDDPTIFYSVAKDIIPKANRYTPTHKFIAMLHEHGKLLTNYSQNIDNLEVKAGVPKDKLIQCHGSFGTATCIKCEYKVKGETIFPDMEADRIPRCTRCLQNTTTRTPSSSSAMATTSGKRKRPSAPQSKKARWSERDGDTDSEGTDDDITEAGVMKPDITFFGEELPDEFSRRLTENDRDKVDLVIVIGTSLKVTPVSEIVSWLPPNVPQIYISREVVGHINFDIDLLGDCDVVIAELCRRLGWDLNHEMAVPESTAITVEEVEGYKSRHTFKLETEENTE